LRFESLVLDSACYQVVSFQFPWLRLRALRGKITDAHTGNAIRSVNVRFFRSIYPGFEPNEVVLSGDDGGFKLTPKRKVEWGGWIPPVGVLLLDPVGGEIQISADGYEPMKMWIFASRTNRWQTNLGAIRLSRPP
jgi:hypothetical protein